MRSVFLLTSGTAFGKGLESLLRGQTELDVVGHTTDEKWAIDRIQALKPDVIIVEDDDPTHDPRFNMARLFKAEGRATFIHFSLENNWMRIYHVEQRIPKRVEDLVDAIKASKSKDSERAIAQVLERIAAEPSYRIALQKLLAFCETPRSAGEVHQGMLSFPEMKTAFHSPQVLLGWMVQAGGVEPVEREKEEPQWQTTEAGRSALTTRGPAQLLLHLFAQEPVYREIYRRVLEFCVTPRTRAEIETAFQDDPVLQHPKLYPSSIVEALEAAGGLEWNGKWCATEAGKGVAGNAN